MPPYLSPLHLGHRTLPDHCEPANDFLYSLSVTLGSCVPTNLALISTLLGTLSIVSWLFAQLPQIYKNYKLKSTSGLSIFFLAEWLLGDLSNLLGSLFTQQATWQVIIASYYVFVDCALCGQWVWYALLKHGRPLRPALDSKRSTNGHDGSGMNQTWDGMSIAGSSGTVPDTASKSSPDGQKNTNPPPSPGQSIPKRSNPMDAFRMPNYARSPGSTKEFWQGTPTGTTPTQRDVRRVAASSPPSAVSPSPKTVLYISLLLAILSHTSAATPVSPFAPAAYVHRTPSLRSTASSTSSSPTATETAGKILSWMSTILYLGSRLPQLYKNHVRKSTAGLSPTLFLAAFFGNLFYSTSLLTNPCGWFDFAPGEGQGWVGPEGSVRADWVLRAMPFFLGAAGVLVMDAAVGFQFWYFGEGDGEADGDIAPRGRGKARSSDDDSVVSVVLINDDGARKRRRVRWRRVSGWMRGWVPAVSVAGTPSTSRAPTPAPDAHDNTKSTAAESDNQRSQSIPIASRGALDEARALLGTQRHASPRSFGYGGTSMGSSQ
ncbi:PQ-loop-domain-containing protein [Periconia macrospinosa]|uniref:PQ-loop-domain-containing protein n=1 Tax=Periconia macrospinosa TaxID=97972 RepID=A0A2V1E3R0_9PLEO|nr:PQ-loop-domain-containing protein [Periconia macrospinosa]